MSMFNFIKVILIGLFVCCLTACGQSKENNEDAVLNILPKSSYASIDWTDLMPMEDIEALMKPPKAVYEVEEGSFEDQIGTEFPDMAEPVSNDPYHQALVSTKVKPEMNGKAIKLPGFIVPLEFNDKQAVTQFFLVPFFGACIHVPPPPPNQIIFVDYPAGLTQSSLDEPFWLYGILKTSLTVNQTASSAYALEIHHFELYSEE